MIYLKFYQSVVSILGAINSNINIAVAVSGGADSLALCFLFDKLVKEHGGNFCCVTIDHQLRRESSSEAQKVNEILNYHNIKHYILPWIGEKPKANIQENARIARYKLLADFCKQHSIGYLATGHQKNDQAENFIIRLEHGSGIYGLSGIPQMTDLNGVTVIRPLLKFSKEELQGFLVSEGIKWIEDPSNQNEHFARVRIRKVLSQYPGFIDKIATASINLSRAKEVVEYMLQNSLNDLVNYPQSNIATFSFDKFNQLPQEIKFRMLAKLLQEIGGNLKPARGERIENLIAKIQAGLAFKASTLAGCLIKRKREQIIITREVS